MISIKNIFEDDGFINYIYRFVEYNEVNEKEKYFNNSNNWREPNEKYRLDKIILKHFEDKKRCYFVENNLKLNCQQLQLAAFNEAFQERTLSDKNLKCISYQFNFNEYMKKCDKKILNKLQQLFYIKIEEKQFNEGLSKMQYEKIEKIILENKNLKENIVGIKIPTKFKPEKNAPFFYNVVIFNKNILYDVLIENLYIENKIYFANN